MRISHSGKKLVVITGGDPSGIGPEIILKALTGCSLVKKITPLIIGDYKTFRKNAEILKIDIPSSVRFMDLKNVPPGSFRFGRIDKAYGRASMEYLSRGVSIVKSTRFASLVTAPINKESINKAGFKFPGHTEFLSHITKSKKVTMMLVGGGLRVSLVTRHIPLGEVAGCITKNKIIQTAESTHYALKRFFRIPRPKIGIAGLNPHAGEGGILGKEEKKIILPAVNCLRRKSRGTQGPFAPDTLFYKAYKQELDGVVCMYHDQGLIPLKMVAFDKGVNLTIGLPFIRTSPDHGTGFDIAGKGEASPSSMVEAIKLAAKLSC
ncbi:MAG: 4-hydroxythreonine-4-phosphate dehydrogenase PdxA [Candidatus Omnitrophota bacterium]|nr:MAG: 4-hydroxythreonine-4-phosphate dehydrogenase PdxA [Candidatus Omnitrophota bacterium]